MVSANGSIASPVSSPRSRFPPAFSGRVASLDSCGPKKRSLKAANIHHYRRSGLVECEGDKKEPVFALDLKRDGTAGRDVLEDAAQTVECGDGHTIERAYDVAGGERDFAGGFGGARDHQDAERIAQGGQHSSNFLVNFDSENPERANETFLRVGERGELVHFVGARNDRHIYSQLLCAAEDFDMDFVSGVVAQQMKIEIRQAYSRSPLQADDDVLNANPGGFGGAAGKNVGDDDAGIARKIEGGGKSGRNRLNPYSDFPAVNVAVLADLLERYADNAAGNGEAEALIASGLGEDECVDSHDFAVDVNQRSARVSRVDRGVGLNINEGRVGIDLAGGGTDHAHADAVAQPFGAAKGEDQLALAQIGIIRKRKRREILGVNFDDREINVAGDADNLRGNGVAAVSEGIRRRGVTRGHRRNHLDALRPADNVGVGDDVSGGINDETGADSALPADDYPGLPALTLFERAISGNENLHHARRNFPDQGFDRRVEIAEGFGVGCGLGCDRRRTNQRSRRDGKHAAQVPQSRREPSVQTSGAL